MQESKKLIIKKERKIERKKERKRERRKLGNK